MDSLSLRPSDLFNTDPRPTCVLDLHREEHSTASLLWRNTALAHHPRIIDGALEHTTDRCQAEARLSAWLSGTLSAPASISVELPNGYRVYGYTIHSRWRVTQWTPQETPTPDATTSDDLPPSLPASEAFEDVLADRNKITTELANMGAMMEMCNIGFYQYDMDGRLMKGNDAFYHLSGHPRVANRAELPELSFADCVFEDDKDLVFRQWTALTKGNTITFEMRWKRPAWTMPAGEEDHEGHWVLAACVPVRNKHGDITSISGCITDIAAQKRSQAIAMERADALERAAASERRFKRFCENSNVAIVLTDINLQVTYCNRQWFAILDHPVCDFKDVDWTPYIHPDDLQYATDCSFEVLRTKTSKTFQFRLRKDWSNENGSGPTWLMTCAYPELDEDGSVRSIAATIVDVSYLRWAEDVQRQRVEEAVIARRKQENFIDFTCHEVRNPLGAVMHSAEIIDSTLAELNAIMSPVDTGFTVKQRSDLAALTDGIQDSVNTIMTCSMHQKRIMDDILTLSKLDSRLLNISPAPVRLADILVDVRKMFDQDANKMGVDLFVLHDPGSAAVPWVMLDAGRLLQVLINLITNALKFTQNADSRRVTVTMRVSHSRPVATDLGIIFIPSSTRTAGDIEHDSASGSSGAPSSAIVPDADDPPADSQDIFVSFIVTDTGCGFSEAKKDTIFERFAQASPKTHTQYGGSGLGLFITRELIELQGGHIGVTSRPGQGARFGFYVVGRAVDPAAVPRPMSSADKEPVAIEMRTFSILVVEDNLVNQKVLRKQLEKLGHKVHLASHGVDALSFLETSNVWTANDGHEPDQVSSKLVPSSCGAESHPETRQGRLDVSIILMDVEMPVMDGLTCARKIRDAQAQGKIIPDLPIIAVSANARYEQVSQALESGMDDAITKPFRIDELMAKVARLVGRS